jgi:hypothetical protein
VLSMCPATAAAAAFPLTLSLTICWPGVVCHSDPV